MNAGNTFGEWKDAREAAETRAREWRVPQGIERIDGPLGKYWSVVCLPTKDRRFGRDARIEAVEVP